MTTRWDTMNPVSLSDEEQEKILENLESAGLIRVNDDAAK